MGKKQNPLRIIEFHAEHVKRLNAVTIRPDPEQSVVLLTGKNRQGKSSTIDAIWWALGGKSAIPSKPIKKGASGAMIQLDLGEFTVTRRFTENGKYLEIRTKDGFKAPRPQEFLSTRLADRARNPLEFMRLSSEDQVIALQDMVDIKLDPADFARITGLDTRGIKPESDPIKLLDDAYGHIYKKRTDTNIEVRRLDGATKSLMIEIPPDRRDTKPVSVQGLFEERKLLEKTRQRNDERRRLFEEDARAIAAVRSQIADKTSEIEVLEAKLASLRGAKDILEHRVRITEEAHNREMATVTALTDPDFSDIDARIAAADEMNRVAGQIKLLSEHEVALAAVRAESGLLSQKLTDIKEFRKRLIEEAGLPVPGLGLEGGEVTFNGIPLSQASGREQIEISCAICAAQNPSIGILTIDVGWSDLDAEGKAALESFAKEKGLQIWCTQVMESPGDLGFHIYDGNLVAVNGVASEIPVP